MHLRIEYVFLLHNFPQAVLFIFKNKIFQQFIREFYENYKEK